MRSLWPRPSTAPTRARDAALASHALHLHQAALGGEAVVPGPHAGVGALYDGVDLLVGREDAGSEREGDEAQTGKHQHLQTE